ncbi:MAG: hypothetical protein U0T11_01030 [Chitinophagaceae bacterium]
MQGSYAWGNQHQPCIYITGSHCCRANQNAALMAILGFPLIIPQLLLLVKISKSAFGEIFRENALLQMTLLLGGLDIMIIVLSLILFPFCGKINTNTLPLPH